jgi:hypothetical protein
MRYIFKSRRMRWEGHVGRSGRRGIDIGFWRGKSEIKRPLGKSRLRGGDNIKMNLREMGWAGMDWICLTQDMDLWRPFVNTVTNHLVL